jgi:DNA-binding MarR family transcriptional regulator
LNNNTLQQILQIKKRREKTFMQFGNLGVIEKKVLGALLILSDKDNTTKATHSDIAQAMGYKTDGGAITFALKILERDNFIVRTAKGTYKLLV